MFLDERIKFWNYYFKLKEFSSLNVLLYVDIKNIIKFDSIFFNFLMVLWLVLFNGLIILGEIILFYFFFKIIIYVLFYKLKVVIEWIIIIG